MKLSDLIKDWLASNGWEILEVKNDKIVLKNLDLDFVGSPTIPIYHDNILNINAADPLFFEKLEERLLRKYFSRSIWYQKKTNPGKPRKQIWP